MQTFSAVLKLILGISLNRPTLKIFLSHVGRKFAFGSCVHFSKIEVNCFADVIILHVCLCAEKSHGII